VPDVLDAQRILADDEPLHQLPNHGQAGGAARAVGQPNLAQAVDVRIRPESEENQAEPLSVVGRVRVIDLSMRDLHDVSWEPVTSGASLSVSSTTMACPKTRGTARWA